MASNPPPPPSFSFSFPSSVSAFNVPAQEYLAAHSEYHGLISGALVFDNQDRLLLLQRAAHDSMPNRWEVPGGAVDADDESILHGVARELWEESGLVARAMGQQVAPLEGNVVFTRSGLKVCRCAFIAEVESTECVTLDPNEHQDYVWASEEDCKSYKVEREGLAVEIKFTTEATEATVLDGFRLLREARSGGKSRVETRN